MKKSFKQFISEDRNVIKEWDTRRLSKKDAVNYLLNNCERSFSNAIKKGGLLFRGFRKLPGLEGQCVVINPSTGKRTSKDTSNLYQLMMDESEIFKDYPSRSKSLICATSSEYTTMYGETYVVVPKDNAKVCHIDTDDILELKLNDKIWSYGLQGSKINLTNLRLTALGKFISAFKNSKTPKFTDAQQLNKRMSEFTIDELCVIFLHAAERGVKEYFQSRYEDTDSKFYKEFYDKIVRAYSHEAGALIGATFDSFNIIMHPPDYEDIKKFKQLIKDLGKLIGQLDDSKAGPVIADFRDLLHGIRIDRIFSEISTNLMTPQSLGISLTEFGKRLPLAIECWTDSECLVIPIHSHSTLITPSVFTEILNESVELGLVSNLKNIDKRYHKFISEELLKNERKP